MASKNRNIFVIFLRFDGELEFNQAGHISGPKYCDGIFYPRVFAKKLRSLSIIRNNFEWKNNLLK